MTDIGASLAYLMGSRTRPNMAVWIADAVERIPPNHNARLEYALALAGASIFSGGITGATEFFASLTSEVADQVRRAHMMSYVMHVSRFFQGDTDFVIHDGPSAMENAKASGLLREAGAIGTDLALALFYNGDTARAKEVAADVLDLANTAGSPSLLAWALYVQGEILGETDPARAIELLDESIDNGLAVGNEFMVGISLTALSSIAGRMGDMPTALDAMHRCIRLWRTAGNRPQMWTAVRNLAEVLHALGDDEAAATLHYAVEADLDHAPALFGPFGDHYRDVIAATEAALDPAAVERAARHGGAFDYPTAAQFALDAIDRAMASLND
jgi:tetratricopeptide (TPR) repeat protein